VLTRGCYLLSWVSWSLAMRCTFPGIRTIQKYLTFWVQVIVMEPFFDQYISNIEMAGGKIVYVPLHPPAKGDTEICPASEWKLDLKELEAAITDKTRMIVSIVDGGAVGIVLTGAGI
jgi:bifunctional pyridoxal-dependent enzyme with beta-cystathionase and maltose regulon repressor activities